MQTKHKAEYLEYIASKEWKSMRMDIIKQRGMKCEKCNKQTYKLQLHHLTYKNLYFENSSDLMLLCAKCHQIEHHLIKQKGKKVNIKNLQVGSNKWIKEYKNLNK